MADIRPFNCVRPAEKYADQVAALPYDVYNREEAAEQVKDKPYSFFRPYWRGTISSSQLYFFLFHTS